MSVPNEHWIFSGLDGEKGTDSRNLGVLQWTIVRMAGSQLFGMHAGSIHEMDPVQVQRDRGAESAPERNWFPV